MNIEKATCPYCGAALKMRADQKTVKCEYCGSVSIVTGSEPASGTEKEGRFPEGGLKKKRQGESRNAASAGGVSPDRGSTAGGNGIPAPPFSRRLKGGTVSLKDRLLALLPPPGFRSGNAAHMVTAVAGYLLILSLAIGMSDPLEALFVIAGSLSAVDVFTDWTGFYSGLKGLHSRSTFVRIFMKCFWGLVVFLAWVVVMAILQTMFGL